MYVSKLPIVKANDSTLVEKFADYVLYFHQHNISSAQDKLMLEYFEQIINGLVYELYLLEDLHAHGFTFANHLQAENLPALDDIKGDKLEALHSIFQRLYAQNHPIRQNLFALDTLPVIRLIEGKV